MPQETPLVPKFRIGRLVITPRATEKLTQDDVIKALVRHLDGDWGDLDEFDWKTNDDAVEFGNRLLSTYRAQDGTVFWIITEHDRSATTVLLPAEY